MVAVVAHLELHVHAATSSLLTCMPVSTKVANDLEEIVTV